MTYVRLEPRSRSDDPHEGLRARVADPLWMLGRQWQLGEWAATDRGSPVSVEVVTKTDPITNLRLGANVWRPVGDTPVEAQVEAEPPLFTWRDRVRTGQLFEQMLREAFPARASAWIVALRQNDGVTPVPASQLTEIDDATRSYRRLYAGRTIDGKSLYESLVFNVLPGAIRLPSYLSVPAGETARLTALSRLWIERGKLSSFVTTPSNGLAWKPDELAYEFGLRTEGGSEFATTRYNGGSLDWHTLQLTKDADDGLSEDAAPRVFEPTRVSFAGMPELRFFDIEDRVLSFDALSVDKVDWLKLALRNFAFDFRNDWWHVPLPVPASSFTRIRRLVVTDTFGVKHVVHSAVDSAEAALERWSAFAATGPDGRPTEGLLLPGVVAHREKSEPIEQVAFIFDELENRIWAEERIVQDQVGNTVAGALYHIERQRRRDEHNATAERLALERAVEAARRALDVAQGFLHTPGISAAASNSLVNAARVELESALDALVAHGAESHANAAETLPRWRLGQEIPLERIPYVVRKLANTEQIAFRRARLERREGGLAEAISRLVAHPAGSTWIREEVVPSTGKTVEDRAQYSRSYSGKTIYWRGRHA